MKKLILFILILSILYIATACWSFEVDMEIIKKIESSGNPLAYNKRSGATGLFQVTEICLEDYNNHAPVKICIPPIVSCLPDTPLRITDMYNPLLSYHVANWYMNTRIPYYLNHYKREDTIRNRLISYNCGIAKRCYEHTPRETLNYIKKYNKLKGE